MKTFNDYTEKAITRFGLRGQNAVARELNITTASMSNFMSGKITPSESTMIKLAELAGLPKEEALIDLNMWRSKDKPELQKVWQRISKMIGCLLMVLILSTTAATACNLGTNSPSFDNQNSSKIYIMRQILLFYSPFVLYFWL